ncbi:hypothetical protein F991_01633 [Acinetobacter sp. CIP-A165]|nr:hypothetical protein F991_01633 [Acinetobacter sp. CIP-A165]
MSQNQDNSKQQPNQQNQSPGQHNSLSQMLSLQHNKTKNSQLQSNLAKIMGNRNNHYFYACKNLIS